MIPHAQFTSHYGDFWGEVIRTIHDGVLSIFGWECFGGCLG